jgi:hypothetical protein
MVKKILTTCVLGVALLSFQTDMKKVQLIKGLSAALPKEFIVMIDDDIAQKYPTQKKPLAMYNSTDKSADFGVNYAINKWNNKNLSVLKDIYKSTISSVFTSVTYLQDGLIKNVNGREYIVFEFVSELVDDKRPDSKNFTVRNYSYLMYTIVDKKILVFNFTSVASGKEKWMPVASAIMTSIVITDKFKIEDYTPFEPDRPPLPKSNDKQMEMIRKMRDNKAKKQELE